ncbi:glycosyltransferase family 2 protein [Ancylobacter sp. IITR112]|uniref:glycosyltransferase family 2 protein n=1 Tax=Ancylobacter sp. IITR112 TaxID=3138073 RepID=UPI00352B13A8
MRIASISLVKDEADIIEGFVRHNLHFVDRMFIVDDHSNDHTSEILRRLAAETPAVVLVDDGWTGAFHQSRRTTALLRQAAGLGDWDFIVPLDADELICAPDRESFEASLAAVPHGVAAGVGALFYCWAPGDDMTIRDPLTRLTTALEPPAGHIFKAIAPAALFADPDLTYVEGNHALTVSGGRVPVQRLAGVELAHFAVRSPDQIVSKCLKHYVGWRSRSDYKEHMACQAVAAVNALKQESGFAVAADAGVVRAYLPPAMAANSRHRPFIERRGTLKWPELATPQPYAELAGLLDGLIDRAALSDQIVAGATAAGGEMSVATLRALMDERNALEAELTRLRNSSSALTRSYMKLLRQRFTASLRKRRMSGRALLRRLFAA